MQSGDALSVQVGGQTGILEFGIVLAWWGVAIQQSRNSETAGRWMEAIVDMSWILGIENISG